MKKAVFILENCDGERARMLISEIGKVRSWLTGFAAAGKHGPPGEDSLRQVQQLLKDALYKRSGK